MSGFKYFLFFLVFCSAFSCWGQGSAAKTFLLSGIVTDHETGEPVPGVHLFIPDAGRGTSTDQSGYFALRVIENDSIVVSYIGFKTQHYIVPDNQGNNLSVIIELKPNTTLLPAIVIYPYPTEELFREAFFALELDDETSRALRNNLDQEIRDQFAIKWGMDPALNYSNYMNQFNNRIHSGNFEPSIPLLNPFAWAQLFQSIKRGDFSKEKREKYKKYYRDQK